MLLFLEEHEHKVANTPESGVMCLNFHSEHCSLLAVGCYDGIVMIVTSEIGNRPIYSSSIRTGRHTDQWQVQWQIEDIAKELSFSPFLRW